MLKALSTRFRESPPSLAAGRAGLADARQRQRPATKASLPSRAITEADPPMPTSTVAAAPDRQTVGRRAHADRLVPIPMLPAVS